MALLLVAYIGVAVVMANQQSARDKCRGFDIRILQDDGSRDFVTQAEVRRLLKEWSLDDTDRPASSINLQKIEDRLSGVVNIESAMVERMPDNTIRLTLMPMIPMARVFDFKGNSYYINRDGKRLTANARYHIDVPVISGNFDSIHSPASLIPLVECLHSDPQWNAITSQVMVDPHTRDIILVPLIRGHVVNLGDTSDIPDKLTRVMTMYRKVMPSKAGILRHYIRQMGRPGGRDTQGEVDTRTGDTFRPGGGHRGGGHQLHARGHRLRHHCRQPLKPISLSAP